jgi:hypothetical protein
MEEQSPLLVHLRWLSLRLSERLALLLLLLLVFAFQYFAIHCELKTRSCCHVSLVIMKIILLASLLLYLASCFTIPTPAMVKASMMALQQAVNGKNGLAQKTKVIVLGGDGFCG